MSRKGFIGKQLFLSLNRQFFDFGVQLSNFLLKCTILALQSLINFLGLRIFSCYGLQFVFQAFI